MAFYSSYFPFFEPLLTLNCFYLYMEFLPKHIDQYSEQHTTPASEVLQNLERETYAKILMPRMCSGHLQGQALKMFTSMIQPKRVLEVGTYTGYSAIAIAEAMPSEGILHTIDINEELEDMVSKYVQQAGLQDIIKQHIGPAAEIIEDLNETWDMVFIDADKENYSKYYDLTFPNLRLGGFILADNVLWSGRVTESTDDKDTEALKAYNQKIQNDPRVENILLPIRDGIMISRKISD